MRIKLVVISFLGSLVVGLLVAFGPAIRWSTFLPSTATGSALSHDLEAPLPAGAETDPFAIHQAQGITDIPNRSMVERLKGQLEMTAYSFEGISPRREIEGIFKVADEDFWPPDAAGTGPFYLVKEQGKYFVLTEGNFARVYGPIAKQKDVLPYARVYGDLFLIAFGTLVTEKRGHSEGNTIYYPGGAPEVTVVKKSGLQGYTVRLVYYTSIHRECFYAIDVRIGRNGMVKKLGEKMLKDLGPGGVF